jgi:DNA-binding NarL/FixJ family response regulator
VREVIAGDSDIILERLLQMHNQDRKVEHEESFKNGTETLEAMCTLKPDLANLDIKMTGLSRLHVLKEIRKEDNASKFIIPTFYAKVFHQQKAIHAGADNSFEKALIFKNPKKIELITS